MSAWRTRSTRPRRTLRPPCSARARASSAISPSATASRRVRDLVLQLLDLSRAARDLFGGPVRAAGLSRVRARQVTARAPRAALRGGGAAPPRVVGARLERAGPSFLSRARRRPDDRLDRAADDRRGAGTLGERG